MKVHSCAVFLCNAVRLHALAALVAVLTLALAPKPSIAQVSATSANGPNSQTPMQVRSGKATLTQHYDPAKMLRLTIALTPQHIAEQRQLIQALHDRNSPQFHQFLTPEQWDARFAPSAQDEQAVVDWATSVGFTINQRYPDRYLVDVQAPAGVIEKALGVTINNYQIGSTTYFANDRDPILPGGLHTTVQAILGLDSFLRLRPAHVTSLGKPTIDVARPDFLPGPSSVVAEAQRANGSSQALAAALTHRKTGAVPDITDGNYDPTDIYSSEAYDWNALQHLGHCCNPAGNPGTSPPQTTIAIASFGDLNYADVAAFQSRYDYLAYNINKKYIDGGYTCNNNNPNGYDDNCLEVTLDTEYSIAMSNSFGSYADTAMIWVYEGASFGDIYDVYNQMATDNLGRVSSTSWGCEEFACFSGGGMNTIDGIFAKLVGQGWTLIAASGDQGASAGCGDATAVQFPASDPNMVAAGGTLLSLSEGPIYLSEVGWTGGTAGASGFFPGDCAVNDGGSTGGYSAWFGAPGYQSQLGVGARAVPDIALNADAFQNMYFAQIGGWIGVGGTSIVAPELAGFFAQENAYGLVLGNVCGSAGTASCAPLGNANYAMYNYTGGGPSSYHYPFYDITSGCNTNDVTIEYSLTYYCAQSGFDEVTGWGSMNALQLAWAINWENAFTTTGGPTVSMTGPVRNVWYNSNQEVSWTVADTTTGGPGTGIAGFTQGWDSIPSDVTREANPGSGNSFYSGPQYANLTAGCLAFVTDACAGGVSQGWHYAYVQAWNNMGVPSGVAVYGPIGYDTVAPFTKSSLSGTLVSGVYKSPVTVTLSATDATSGVAATYYRIGTHAFVRYSGPFTIDAAGSYALDSYSVDVAGNVAPAVVTKFKIGAVYSIKLSKTALTFPNTVKGKTSAAITFQLTNTGTEAVTLDSISIGGADAGSFLIASKTCTGSLGVAASCTVGIEFKPASVAELTAAVSIRDNASGSLHSVTLKGRGIN
jgi:hypothetical protein